MTEARRVPDGTSEKSYADAIHEAVEYKMRGEPERPGIRFNITDAWVETIERQSPWHITFNVIITKAPDSG